MGGEGVGLVMPPTTHVSGRCALCLERFRVGEGYTTIWPKDGLPLAIQVHAGCRAELDPGDLVRIFDALARGLAVPIGVLFGRQLELGRMGG